MSVTPTFNPEQKAAFKAIKKFLDHPSANIFVLQGYAGTGKTFLMQQLAIWLTEQEQEFCLLASTGRAATVLKGKTGFPAKTVHSEVYNFSSISGINDEMLQDNSSDVTGQLSMEFTTRIADEAKRLYIVDEASMLSCEISKEESFASYGSGIVLKDFFKVVGKNKIIFVGDPCQLPPVGQSFSPALNVKWLTDNDKVALSVKLEKIERTNAKNDILKLATAIRQMYDSDVFELYPKLPAADLTDVKLYTSDEELFRSYLEKYRSVGATEALAIGRTNKMVQHINKSIRRELFGTRDMPLQLNEILLVCQNNRKVPLTNGDFVKVCELGAITHRSGMHFQKVKVKPVSSDTEYDLLLSLDSMHSKTGNLSSDQMQTLTIDFTQRMRAKNINVNTADYRNAMRDDEYYNCLKATYGYAVTCHKAQGGEWNNVYLFLDNDKNGMYNMPPQDLCKWWYTSVTRARQKLHLVKHWWVI
jgi:ATP-dependent exoDNAse (exonuclease V) alpha subunit